MGLAAMPAQTTPELGQQEESQAIRPAGNSQLRIRAGGHGAPWKKNVFYHGRRQDFCLRNKMGPKVNHSTTKLPGPIHSRSTSSLPQTSSPTAMRPTYPPRGRLVEGRDREKPIIQQYQSLSGTGEPTTRDVSENRYQHMSFCPASGEPLPHLSVSENASLLLPLLGWLHVLKAEVVCVCVI